MASSDTDITKVIGKRKVRFIGKELSPLGKASKMGGFTGPDHVVLNIDKNTRNILGLSESGYYLIDNLSPDEVKI